MRISTHFDATLPSNRRSISVLHLPLILTALVWLGLAPLSYGQYVYAYVQSGSGMVWGYATNEGYESYDYIGVQASLYGPNGYLTGQWAEGWNSAEASVQAQANTTGDYTVYGYGYGSYGPEEGWVYMGEDDQQTYVQVVAQISLTRQSLTQVSGTGTPQGGSFLWAASSYANISFAPGVSGQSNPNSAVLTNAANPSPTGAPSPGALATVSGWYSPPSGSPVSATFHAPTFGMSCYYTALEQDWGSAPNSCGTTTIYGVLYSGSWANPPGLPVGNYCNAFLAQVSLQGSGVLATGTDVAYVSGGYPPSSSYTVVSSIRSADGSPVQAGRTVARDRSIIPGTGVLVDINGIGNGLLANDTGGAISGYRIDYYNGAGRAACAAFSNIMGVSGCNPGNANCPSDTAIQ